ncbi:MAG: nucleotidyltransferase family protein [Pirellulales bacterium]|nr:nucleotidyltransferase family protein [Pirellulales bacterium]
MPPTELGPVSWERMVRAVEKVRDRLNRVAAALDAANIPYGVVGGNAVAAWVSRVDESAVRNTQDVDILLRRHDLERAKSVLSQSGFVFRHAKSLDMFLDGPEAKARDAVHVILAAEKVREGDLAPAADVSETEIVQTDWSVPFRLVSLEPLVRMKLTSYRDKDRMHLRDLIDVGLIDDAWPARFRAELAARLQALLDDPDG